MSFNTRIDGFDNLKKHLDKFAKDMEESKKAMGEISERFYKEMIEGRKIEFNMTLGCNVVNPELIIWSLNSAKNDEEPDFTQPQKSLNKKLKRSLR